MGGILMAKVKFKRIPYSSQINDLPIEDGSFVITGDGKSYIDYGNDRIPTNGTLDTEISDTSRNAVENKVIKEYVDDAIGGLQYNLVENDDPVKTGRKINGYDEYIKYITSTAITTSGNDTNISLNLPSGIVNTGLEIWIGNDTFMVPNMWSFSSTNYFRAFKSSSSQINANLGTGANWFRTGMKVHIIVRYYQTT